MTKVSWFERRDLTISAVIGVAFLFTNFTTKYEFKDLKDRMISIESKIDKLKAETFTERRRYQERDSSIPDSPRLFCMEQS